MISYNVIENEKKNIPLERVLHFDNHPYRIERYLRQSILHQNLPMLLYRKDSIARGHPQQGKNTANRATHLEQRTPTEIPV